MRISDWSSDVCSSDLHFPARVRRADLLQPEHARPRRQLYSGEPAFDAGAYRSRMVFLALLRDPACLPLQLTVDRREAVGRTSAVRVDRAPVLPVDRKGGV